jgi:hypothetical protein
MKHGVLTGALLSSTSASVRITTQQRMALAIFT